MRRHKVNPPCDAKLREPIGTTTSVAVTELSLSKIVFFQEKRRPIDPDAVVRLAKSIGREGLKIPIDVVPIKKGMLKGQYRGVTGAHRVEAFKVLGRTTIPAKVLNADQARGLEEAENIVRQAPTALHESIAIVQYAQKLGLITPDVTPRGGRQPHDRGASRIAKETGIDRKRVTEALDHYELSDKIRAKVEYLGFADNRTVLTKLARMKSHHEQTRFLNGAQQPERSSRASGERISHKKEGSVAQRVSELKRTWAKLPFKATLDREAPDVRRTFLSFLYPREVKHVRSAEESNRPVVSRSEEWDDW